MGKSSASAPKDTKKEDATLQRVDQATIRYGDQEAPINSERGMELVKLAVHAALEQGEDASARARAARTIQVSVEANGRVLGLRGIEQHRWVRGTLEETLDNLKYVTKEAREGIPPKGQHLLELARELAAAAFIAMHLQPELPLWQEVKDERKEERDAARDAARDSRAAQRERGMGPGDE
jgi:hypothetical protein